MEVRATHACHYRTVVVDRYHILVGAYPCYIFRRVNEEVCTHFQYVLLILQIDRRRRHDVRQLVADQARTRVLPLFYREVAQAGQCYRIRGVQCVGRVCHCAVVCVYRAHLSVPICIHRCAAVIYIAEDCRFIYAHILCAHVSDIQHVAYPAAIVLVAHDAAHLFVAAHAPRVQTVRHIAVVLCVVAHDTARIARRASCRRHIRRIRARADVRVGAPACDTAHIVHRRYLAHIVDIVHVCCHRAGVAGDVHRIVVS